MDPLALLERPDKWFLGGGRTLIYAPPFPQYLHTPGLWDEAHLLDFEHPRPFTWTLVNESNLAIPLTLESLSWRPDRIVRSWSTTQGFAIRESVSCLKNDVLFATVSIKNNTDEQRGPSLVGWTLQRNEETTGRSISNIRSRGGGLSYRRTVTPIRRGRRLSSVEYTVYLFNTTGHDYSVGVEPSQFNSAQPDWRFVPFPDAMMLHRTADDRYEWIDDAYPADAIYMATSCEAWLPPRAEFHATIGCAFHVEEPDESERDAAVVSIDPAWYTRIHAFSVDGTRRNPNEEATEAWRQWFESVPSFKCSDPYLTHAYWYRWYGLRLNAIEPPADGAWNYKHPAVCEGIQYFRDLVSYSAQVHMRELRWMHDPTFAQGSLRNFIDHQKPDGNFPGNIYATFVHNDDMYHADWGRSLLDLHAIHSDGAFLEEAYEPLCRYARFFLTERDPDGAHLFDVVDQWETGQEYMHRYTAVDSNADGGNELHPHLKGVDATLYMYNLFRALAEIAAGLEKPEEAADWEAHADATERAMLGYMWDAEAGMFSDVNAATLERTGVRAAVDFYPFLTLDLGTDEYLRALREHLLNPEEFWTEFPVPAEAANDPEFSAEPFWRGERKNCPWNGRVWPMTNSHVAEALARAAQTWAPDLEPAAAEMIHKFVRMMTVDGDPTRPNSYEHYNPLSGTASYYRGIDDYMHSYIVDLIIRFVAGVQPQPDGTVIVNPLPMGLDWFELKDVPYQGHRIGVRWDAASGLTVSVDGEDAGFSPVLTPLPIPVVSDTAF